LSRHAGHETNSARPRVSSPSRRRRASPGTTSDTVANRTIQATIPRRDPDIISGGEAARGVMTVPIEVPSRRRSAGIESGGDFASMVRLPSPRFQTRVARWTRRRAGRRTSPRRQPASGLTARSARVFETSACPSSSRRTSWSRRRCALAPPTDFSPPTPPSIANNDDSFPFPLPQPAPPDRVRVRPPPAHVRSLRSRARRRPPRGPPRPILVLGRRRRPRRRVGE